MSDTIDLAARIDEVITTAKTKVKASQQELLQGHVEDPVMKVRLPKFADGATLDHDGQTYYLVDELTKRKFAQQKGAR